MMGFPTRCPNCASAITIDSNRKIAYCEYCGTQLTRSTQQQELDIAEERIKYKLLKHTERIKELDYWHEKTKSEFRLRSAEISNKYLERILKIIGKLALFPAWLFSIKVLYDNFFRVLLETF